MVFEDLGVFFCVLDVVAIYLDVVVIYRAVAAAMEAEDLVDKFHVRLH